MSTLSLTDKASAFRFTRPALGQNRLSASLDPQVAKALEESEQLLALGFPPPQPELETEARNAERQAESDRAHATQLGIQARRAEREADEAAREHAALEDVAAGKAREAEEARPSGRPTHPPSSDAPPPAGPATKPNPSVPSGKGSSKGGGYSASQTGNPPSPEPEKARDEARLQAAEARSISLKNSAQRDDLQAQEAEAIVTATTAEEQASHARQAVVEGESNFRRLLLLPLFSIKDGVETLLTELAKLGANDTRVSLSEIIDRQGRTADLYEVKDLINHNRSNLDFNTRHILTRPRLAEFLFARTTLAGPTQQPESIFNTLVSPQRISGGWRNVYDFAIERSLDLLRKERKLQWKDANLLKVRDRLVTSPVSLQKETFQAAVETLLKQFVFDADEQAILQAGLTDLGIRDTLPAEYVGPLLQYIKTSNEAGDTITPDNAAYFVSIALSKLRAHDTHLMPGSDGSGVEVEDYSVSYYESQTDVLAFDRSSINAAAQLYLTMVWGDELGIFETINRIGNQSTPNLRLEIRSRQLSDDLRLYVLDEEFRDLKTGRINRRVSPAERQMFYRQLFGVGQSPVVDESQINTDFQRLWAVLMTEVVKYIGKVELNGDTLSSISAQKVYQAIEDLQYNLSIHASGIAKVAAPTIHGEMDFVIRRLLDSDDVKSQLARRGGRSFWKVVEEVRGVQDFTPLRNKGMYGHRILTTVAQASPALLEETRAFADFISTVEAYILAEDQLADAGQMPPSPGQFPGFYGFDPGSLPGMPANLPGMPTHLPGMPSTSPAAANRHGNGLAKPEDDWNF